MKCLSRKALLVILSLGMPFSHAHASDRDSSSYAKLKAAIGTFVVTATVLIAGKNVYNSRYRCKNEAELADRRENLLKEPRKSFASADKQAAAAKEAVDKFSTENPIFRETAFNETALSELQAAYNKATSTIAALEDIRREKLFAEEQYKDELRRNEEEHAQVLREIGSRPHSTTSEIWDRVHESEKARENFIAKNSSTRSTYMAPWREVLYGGRDFEAEAKTAAIIADGDLVECMERYKLTGDPAVIMARAELYMTSLKTWQDWNASRDAAQNNLDSQIKKADNDSAALKKRLKLEKGTWLQRIKAFCLLR